MNILGLFALDMRLGRMRMVLVRSLTSRSGSIV